MKTTIFSFAVLMITLVSCQKQSVSSITPIETSSYSIASASSNSFGCAATKVSFIAGQNIDAGTIEVSNDANFIYVTYNTANGYVLTATHLFVGNCEIVPVNAKGNPIPGQFPYKNRLINILMC